MDAYLERFIRGIAKDKAEADRLVADWTRYFAKHKITDCQEQLKTFTDTVYPRHHKFKDLFAPVERK